MRITDVAKGTLLGAILIAAFCPAGLSQTTAPADGPLHPPLKVLERFKITEYPIIGWAFHGAGQGYDAAYIRAAKAAGFNALIESQEMLKPAAEVGGMKIMAVAFRFDRNRIEKQTLNRFGADHPCLMGFVLDDNCRRISGNSKSVATWLKEDHPHLVPYVSENQDTRNQIKTDLRILGTQNWRMKRGDLAGANGYCGRMEMDRNVANIYGMSFWPLWYGLSSPASIRFQIYSAIAYGAQGVVCFAYTPIKPNWGPNGMCTKAHAYAASYVHEVIGRHVLGTRSQGVLHAEKMGDAKHPWVARMDAGLIAGLLQVEQAERNKDKPQPPDYVMLVRKQFSGPDKPSTLWADFTPAIRAVEVLQRKTGGPGSGLRRIEPGFHAAVDLLLGDGRLLIVNPDLKDALGELEKPYLDLCKKGSELAGADDSTKAAAALAAEADKLLATAGNDQAKDTIRRLKAAFEHLAEVPAAKTK